MANKNIVEVARRARRSPVINGGEATFVYRGPARKVELVGDLTGWRPKRLSLRKVRNEPLRYFSAHFPLDARIEYKLIVNGRWVLDPLNRQMVDNGLGGLNSFWEMPAYQSAPAEYGFRVYPTVEEVSVRSDLLGGKRKVKVYLPPGYHRTGERFPVLYLQDGSDYLHRARAADLAEALILSGQIRPFLIVFVDSRDRMREYWANDRFAGFMGTELVPAIDRRYRTRAHRDGRALLGASLGGVTSVWTALRQPDLFGRVGGQSSAFWIDRERVLRALTKLDGPHQRHFRFYFDVGLIEGASTNRRANEILTAKGYPVVYREAWTGHNWTSWRDRLVDAYQALWSD